MNFHPPAVLLGRSWGCPLLIFLVVVPLRLSAGGALTKRVWQESLLVVVFVLKAKFVFCVVDDLYLFFEGLRVR